MFTFLWYLMKRFSSLENKQKADPQGGARRVFILLLTIMKPVTSNIGKRIHQLLSTFTHCLNGPIFSIHCTLFQLLVVYNVFRFFLNILNIWICNLFLNLISSELPLSTNNTYFAQKYWEHCKSSEKSLISVFFLYLSHNSFSL